MGIEFTKNNGYIWTRKGYDQHLMPKSLVPIKNGLKLLNENDESSKTWWCLNTWVFTDYIFGITNISEIMINFYKIYCYGIVGVINTYRSIIGKTQRPVIKVLFLTMIIIEIVLII